MLPHQQRVVDEKTELDKKLANLQAFIGSSQVFKDLPEVERYRLIRQEIYMNSYSKVLGERIADFPAPDPPKLIHYMNAPDWADCPEGTVTYSENGLYFRKLKDGRWLRSDGTSLRAPSPSAILVLLPEGYTNKAES